MGVRIVILAAIAFAFSAFVPLGVADVDPPSPGYALFKNDLALVDGQCVGTVTTQYTFLTIDTPWGVKLEENSDCSVTPKIYEGPSTETFAYRVGGGAGQSNFFGSTVDMVVTHGLAVTWPISQCPAEAPYYNHPQNGWYTYPPQTSGTCLKTVYIESTSQNHGARSWFTERLDGGIDCQITPIAMGGICTFDDGVSQEVPDWLDPGDPTQILDSIGTDAHRIEQIHT